MERFKDLKNKVVVISGAAGLLAEDLIEQLLLNDVKSMVLISIKIL